MAIASSNRTSRIGVRIASEVLAAVKRAAEIQGRSISDFVAAAAQDAAERTITETQIIRLSLEDQQRVADLLLNRPAPSPALTRAFEAHRQLISEEK
ncbi:DUF1778 domain-containing protein [Phenylobacterium sp.]|uniref:type II toxin-antitoxin system TacA family antitoxin n=1 Tax=Phenylobacterium sp. TaxID=1871053 RepID=UPI003BADB707